MHVATRWHDQDSCEHDGWHDIHVATRWHDQDSCEHDGHEDVCMHVLVIFATNPEYDGLHDRV